MRVLLAPSTGPRRPAEIARAVRRLPDLYLDDGDNVGGARDRLTALAREAAFECLAVQKVPPSEPGAVLGDPVSADGLRALLEGSYRRLADQARTAQERGTLVDLANAVRPHSLR